MKKCYVVGGRLVPADQNAPEAVHPAVGAFHHPAPRFEASLLPDGLGLFPPAADVGREAELVQGPPHLIKVVALVQAQTLGMLRAGRWAWHGEAVHRSPHQLHIVTVGPVHCQSHRNAPGFGQQTAFDAALAPVRGVGAGFSPRPRGIWSTPRPCSANSSPNPSVRHSVPARSAIAPGTPRRRPIPESADGPWSRSKCSWRPTPSTGNRCAARRRYRWHRSGPEPGAVLRPKGGYSPAWESVGLAPPTGRRIPERNWWWGWQAWLGLLGGAGVAWILSLWSSPKFSFNSGFFPSTSLTGYQ